MTYKTALVTGAARGIGLATAHKFLADGWNVVRVDWDAPELEASAKGLDAGGARVLDIVGDISLEADVAAMLAPVQAFSEGGLDALVNNAGIADFGPMETTDFARWRRIMSINLDGTFLMSQTFIPALKVRKGAIVNIASISALRASTLRVAYGTSKAAVAHLTEQQAAELGEYGVRANCVAPGPVRTKLAMAVHTPEIIAAYHDAIPLNRYGHEAELAEAICWLCSDKASYVTGQTLAVDGGFQSTGIGLPALRG
jgi:NAD(P)-dependent dehydrogenase (short-subunit alcohol dehydrogenase family)